MNHSQSSSSADPRPRRALVTGGSGDIGAAIARRLAIAKCPGGRGQFVAVEEQAVADRGNGELFVLREQYRQAGLQGFAEVLAHNFQNGSRVDGHGQITAQVIKALGLEFAFAQGLGPDLALGHQGADDQAHGEQAEKSE